MDDAKSTTLMSGLSTRNLSSDKNRTELFSKVYVFPPLSPSPRITLTIMLTSVGITALLANASIICYLSSRKNATPILRACSFQKNLNAYILSLAVSDALCAVIAVPLICFQLYFDILHHHWGCRLVRYINFFFPSVTMNNLLIISIGKYFSTRKNPRILQHYTVKKLLWFAWVSASFSALAPASSVKGLRYDFNATHYTVSCHFDNGYFPFRATIITYITVQYFIPSIVIVLICVCLIWTVRSRMKRKIDIQRDNGIRAMLRVTNRRCTIMLIVIMLAAFLPYLPYAALATYRGIGFKLGTNVETWVIVSHCYAVLAYSNGFVNVVIYFVQMEDFRCYLKRKCCGLISKEGPVNSVDVFIQSKE